VIRSQDSRVKASCKHEKGELVVLERVQVDSEISGHSQTRLSSFFDIFQGTLGQSWRRKLGTELKKFVISKQKRKKGFQTCRNRRSTIDETGTFERVRTQIQ
jgi:hypothetical protein